MTGRRLMALSFVIILTLFLCLGNAPREADEGENLVCNSEIKGSVVTQWGFQNFTCINGNHCLTFECGFIEETSGNYYCSLTKGNAVTVIGKQPVTANVKYSAGFEVWTDSAATFNLYLEGTTDRLAEKSFEISAAGGRKVVSLEYVPTEATDIMVKLACTSGELFADDCFIRKVEVPKISLDDGAYIRLQPNSSGIRFLGKIEKEYCDTLKAQKQNLKIGVLISPIDYVNSVDEFTVAALESLSVSGNKYNLAVCVKFGERVENSIEYYEFGGAIVNILYTNLERRFAGRAFISYTEGDETVYKYGDFDESVNARSVYEMAVLAQQELYKYDAARQQIINNYVNKVNQVQ